MSYRKTLELVAGLVIAVLCCALMFYWSFTIFPEYDDEGHMMLKIRHLLDGRAIYDTIVDVYGPFFYLTSWLTYSTLGVPLTTDAARLVNMAYWFVTAALSAAVVWRVTRRNSLTLLTFVAVVFELHVFTSGVSHPQAQASCLMATFALASTWIDGRRLTGPLAVCAAAAGALVFTKINLGVFAILALMFTVAVGTRRTGFWAVARWITVGGAVALPWVLMRGRLGDSETLNYAATMSVSAFLLYWAARTQAWEDRLPNLLVLGIAFAIPGLAACLFMFAHGTTPTGLFEGIIFRAAGGTQTSFFTAMRFQWSALAACISAPAALLLLTRGVSGGRTRFAMQTSLSACLKMAVGLLTLVRLGPDTLLWWLKIPLIGTVFAPYAWLVVVGPTSPANGTRVTRLAISSIALFELLMAYPIAGAQVKVGSFLFIPLTVICLADGLAWLETAVFRDAAVRFRRAEFPLTVVAMLALLCVNLNAARRVYAKQVPLELPGAHWMRLEEKRVVVFRWLAANIDENADTFLVNVGLNSMYSWTNKQAPFNVVLSHVISGCSDEQQTQLVSVLDSYARNMFVYHEPLMPLRFPTERDLAPLLYKEIKASRLDRAVVGGYHVYTQKHLPAPEVVECGRWTGKNTFEIVVAPRLGVGRIGRLTLHDVDSGREVASSRPKTGEACATLSVEPVGLDLSLGGAISVRVEEDGAAIPREHFLVIRLFDEQGRCVGRLPFLEKAEAGPDLGAG